MKNLILIFAILYFLVFYSCNSCSCSKKDYYTTGFITNIEPVTISEVEMSVLKLHWREPVPIKSAVGDGTSFDFWYIITPDTLTLEKFKNKSVSIKYRFIEYLGAPFNERPLVYLIEIRD